MSNLMEKKYIYLNTYGFYVKSYGKTVNIYKAVLFYDV